MPDYSQCLRPQLTQKVVEELCQRKASINLIGAADDARDVLLEDIQKMLPVTTKQVTVSLKNAHKNHDLVLNQLLKKLNLRKPRKAFTLPSVLDKLPKTSTTLIFFNYFDAIMDRADNELDEKYNLEFIYAINNMKDKDHIQVVCVTKYNNSNHLFRGEGSPLELPVIDIQPLNYTELEQAWKRFLTPTWQKWLFEQHHHLRVLMEMAENKLILCVGWLG